MRRRVRGHTVFVPAALTVGMTLLALGNAPAAQTTATVAAPPASADVQLEDYVVKNGDTCVKIAQTRYGDPRRVADIHKHNQLGVSPHRLRVGSVLRLPVVNPDTGPEAQITFVRNQVEAFTPEPKPAVIHESLYRGHKVSTKDQSSAELLFTDETRVQLGERTLIVMLGRSGARTTNEPVPETTLVTGALRAHLAELAGGASRKPTVIKTDAADVALGTGEVKVDVDNKKDTRLAVYRGRSSAHARRKTVEVAEGFGSRTEVGKDPGAPQPLPPAPEWTTPPPTELAVTDLGAFTARYAQPAGAQPPAAAWHVQIARTAAFNDLVVDVRVPEGTRDLQATALVPGPYYVRVSAIDADDFEGPFSTSTLTTVALAPPPPPAPPPPTVVQAPPPPPPPPPPSFVLGGAVFAGLDVSASPQNRLGEVAGLELDLARPRPGATVTPSLGLRGLYEHLGGSANGKTTTPSAQRDGFNLSLVALARFGKAESRLKAYAGVTPFLSIVRVREVDNRVFAHAWLGVGALLGVGVKAGPGHVVLEADGHWPTRRPPLSTDAHLGYVQLLAGYRFGF